MSISSQTSRVQYTLTSLGQTLSVPFYFLEAADLAVVKTIDGVDTTLTRNTHYSVTGEGNPAGGSITLTTLAAPIGTVITIYRGAAFTQPSQFTANGQFPSATVEQSLDRLTMLVQQLREEVNRAYRVPLTEDAFEPAPLADLVQRVLDELGEWEGGGGGAGGESGNNAWLGVSALNSVTTGESLTAIGYCALRSNTSGSDNTGIGSLALFSCTTGVGNTAVGQSAGYALTTGVDNTFVGYRAGMALTSGVNNTGLGTEALKAVTTGEDNVAVGFRSALSVTTGEENTAVGTDSLKTLTTGDANVAVGFKAMEDSTVSIDCTAVGYQALANQTIGTENTAMGRSSLQSLIEGSGLTGIGCNAFFSLTPNVADNDTNDQVAVGKSAGHYLTTGKRTTIVGGFAGYGLSTEDGNTIVGWRAGYSAAGQRCVVIGAEAESGAYNNCIVLGVEAVASGNGQLVLGSAAAPLSTTGGAGAVSTYLTVRVNGTTYKLPLHSP